MTDAPLSQFAGHPDEDVFFALGMPKSGTTWLQKLLAAHPELSCKGEGKFLFFRNRLYEGLSFYSSFLQTYNDTVFGERLFPVVSAPEFDHMFRAFIDLRLRTEVPAGALKIGCKDPELGLYMTSTAAMFPKASYIHLVRDPRDVAVSAWGHTARTDSRFTETPPDLRQMAMKTAESWATYVRGVDRAVAAAGLACHRLRYEDLLASPAEALAGVFGFLGVSTDATVVAACVESASFERASGGRARGQEDAGSFYRKGVAGDWRTHLDEADSRSMLELTQGLAETLGYR